MTTTGQQILDNLHTAVCLFNGDMRLLQTNPAGEALLGASAPRLAGRSATSLFGSERIVTAMAAALDSGHPHTERECTLQPDAERRVTADITAIPLSEGDGAPELLVEIAQVDRQLRIAREEGLIAQQEATRALVRGLAHEIKNPLGGLRGAAQLLAREIEDPDLREYTEVITHEADRLRNLVDRMLGPDNLPAREPVNIHEVTERVRTLVAAEAPPGIRLVRDYDPSLPELEGDRDMLIQAVLNITRNAVQALGEEGTITLRTRAQRQFTIGHRRHRLVLSLEIIDDGPGIPPEMLDRIFYPMVTGRSEGSGLGLSIAQSLVNRHDGLIECTSRPGETRFTLLLPVHGGESGHD